MFQPVHPHPDFPAMERATLRFWEETRAFERLREQNRGRPRFSFLDGPVTANNPLGIHHAWGRTLKDLFQRYQAMLGRDQRWQNGFDCQGLWVEVEVEKELGFRSKRDIEAYGVAEFVQRCIERVQRFAAEITRQSIRLGQWMDWGHDYYTFSEENNYGIWAFIKHCHERGWVYQGADVMPWCPRCGTGISQQEIVTEGYRELTHPGVTVRFPLRERPGEALLVWTTTPWTLPANVAAAVGPDLAYLRVRQGGEVLYVAEAAQELLQGPFEVLDRLRGVELAGRPYDGPFDDLPAARQPGGDAAAVAESPAQAHRVLLWAEVSAEEGSGVVHIAPGCGEEDYHLGQDEALPVLAPLDESGVFRAGYGPFSGRPATEVSRAVIAALRERGLLYRLEPHTHRYPVCWRCGEELVFRLVEEWFIAMDELREPLMAATRQARWTPSFCEERELDWLRNMRDWMISKKRYWGLALPIWKCARCGHFEVIGGREELRARAVEGWELFEGHTPHRPWVDAVKVRCPQCGGLAARVPDVGNPWLDAGIVSLVTMGYWRDRDEWARWFPADMICECFPGQFRNWFYALLAMSTAMVGQGPFRACLGHALVKDRHGEEMHASRGNAVNFDDAMERLGADCVRWLYAAQNPASDVHFSDDLAGEVRRKFLTLWNVYSFFVTYANVDRWVPGRDGGSAGRPPAAPLDRWALSRMHGTTAEVRAALDDYDTPRATRALEGLIDDLSTWYVRRSRRRFWRGGDDADKEAAYATLHACLVTLARLMAPFVPFLAEALYQNLVRAHDDAAPVSVHLCPYPEAGPVDEALLAEVALVQEVVSLGRSARRAAGRKVRQPLATAWVRVAAGAAATLEYQREHVLEELNVKALRLAAAGEAPPAGWAVAGEGDLQVALDVQVSEALRREGLARELVRHLQEARKSAGLAVTDRVALTLQMADGPLAGALEEHVATIAAEVLAVRLERAGPPEGAWRSEVRVEGERVVVGIMPATPPAG